jgi:pimeloyl-ACP methyl ester carboxylesterase
VKFSTRITGLVAGAPCLLIHGLNTNMAFWHPVLVRALGDVRRLVMYDQRGHGYSDMPDSGYTTASLAEDARQILNAYEIESADVVAHSFGSGVALQLARLYPERVRSITIFDGRSHMLQPELRLGEWALFERWRGHFAAVGIEIPPTLDLDFTLPLYLHQSGIQLGEVRRRLVADGFFLPSKSKRAAQKYRRLITETTAPVDFKDNAGLTPSLVEAIRQPTQLIYGSLSPYRPTHDGLVGLLPNCQSEFMEGAGHNFPFLQARETSERVLRFWDSPLYREQNACPQTVGEDHETS